MSKLKSYSGQITIEFSRNLSKEAKAGRSTVPVTIMHEGKLVRVKPLKLGETFDPEKHILKEEV